MSAYFHLPPSWIELWRSIISAFQSAMTPLSLTQIIFPPRLRFHNRIRSQSRVYGKSLDQYLYEVQTQFEAPLKQDVLMAMSSALQEQFREKLRSSTACMLPSFNHTLPSGKERGTYLALDVGGTNFRVALVELTGESATTSSMWMSRMRSFRIDNRIRTLEGESFFDWMAERIGEVLSDSDFKGSEDSSVLPMGLSWSFPINQTSTKSGYVLPMGKGFKASDNLVGRDLGELLFQACQRRNLNVRMEAIINDSSATLLTRAYADNATRIALILGTGFNASAHLPVSLFSSEKFGVRPQSWHDKAKDVLVNTELSMFGKNVFPLTRWDDTVTYNHPKPDYQPFEHLIAGRYLGEIARLVLTEAIRTAGLFDGEMPKNFAGEFSFDTGIMAAFESDDTRTLSKASATFMATHPLSRQPNYTELHFIRQICHLISHRAAAFLATGTHALWCLQTGAEGTSPAKGSRIAIACNGSVIEKYPSFKSTCQNYLDEMTVESGVASGSVVLENAVESAIFGAAVAAACED